MYIIKQKDKYLCVEKNCWVDTIEEATIFYDFEMALYYDMKYKDSEIIRIERTNQ